MSQHDMNIANADGATARADINAALVALVSNNSGATAPATLFPYMWWADSTSGYLKQRNAANTAWLNKFKLAEGELALLNGGAANDFAVRKLARGVGANIASAATLDLTAATGDIVHITGTTATSAVTMASGQTTLCIADGAWPLIYHATNNKITGGADYTLTAGDMVLYSYDGTTKIGQIIKADGTAAAAPLSYVRVNTANGYGSTNTKIRRFTNVVNNVGAGITYADSATLGGTFTLNAAGLYSVSYSDQFDAAATIGLSINSTELTTAIQSIAVADILSGASSAGAGFGQVVSATFYAAAGAVVRAHTGGNATSTNPNMCQFTIARVA